MAWLSGWDKRVKLTIDQNDIDAALSNFPVLVHLGTSVGRNGDDVSFVFDELESDANRKKIAVTTSDGETQCYVEIEKWDDASEQAWLWVKAPSIASDADTDLYLYYDKDHADNTDYVGDPSDAVVHNVWDANFKLVTHMRDDPDNTAVRDSTVNANDGTKKGAGEPVEASGKIDDAQDFDGSDDYIGVLHNESLNPAEITLEVWVNVSDFSDFPRFASKGEPWADKLGYDLFGYSDRRVFLRTGTGTDYDDLASTITLSLNTWHNIVAVLGSGGKKIYIDGEERGSSAEPTSYASSSKELWLAAVSERAGAAGKLEGLLDEVRISAIACTAAWIKASYESERDHLLDFGSEETGVVIVEGSASGSGIGLASSSAKLDVLAQALGNGIGLSLASSYLIVPASSTGSGEGLSAATAYLVVPASVLGSGVGESSADSYLLIPASASASGVGLAEAVAQLTALAEALGSGVGEGEADSYIIIPAGASGSGLGIGDATGIIVKLGTAAGSGIGTGTAQSILDVLASASGSGIGEATIQALLEVLAQASGGGIGLGETTGEIIAVVVVGTGAGSGIGTAIAQGILDVIGQAEGSGVGEATAEALRIIVLTYEEYAELLARIEALELALVPKAHIRI